MLNNRAYFEVNTHSANLVIDHVVEKDAAVYRCRVDFKYAQTRNSKVNLTIIGRKKFFSTFFFSLKWNNFSTRTPLIGRRICKLDDIGCDCVQSIYAFVRISPNRIPYASEENSFEMKRRDTRCSFYELCGKKYRKERCFKEHFVELLTW